jgi:hypothetical protein
MTVDHAVAVEVEEPPAEAIPSRHHWTDRLDRRVLVALTVVGFAVPVLGYLWFVHRYSIDAMVGDQWDDVTVIRLSYLHGFDWSSLWSQHNENRILFPNLIVLALARTVHFDVRIEEYLSACLLVGSMALLILTHRRRSPTTPLLYYVPVLALGFSFVQWSNTTWGFQMAWYLVLISLMAALYLLDTPRLTPWLMAAAVVVAVIGSFSSLQGLLIWPAGLVLLYHRRRPWPVLATWVGIALVTTVVYFHGYRSQGPGASPTLALSLPQSAAKFYLYALGDVLGVQQHKLNQPANLLVLAFGAVLLIMAVAMVVLYGIRRDGQHGSPIGIALIVTGLLFAIMITEGRIVFGYFAAAASRYTTMDLLVPIGIYLTLLDRRVVARAPSMEPATGAAEPLLVRIRAWPAQVSSWADARVLRGAQMLIVALVAVQVVVGLPQGLTAERANFVYQSESAHVLRTIDHQPDPVVVYYLYVFSSAPYLRAQAKTLEHYHLSIFGS